MIILGFIIDYLVSLNVPFNTYFIINEIDKNDFLNIIIVGILFDIMYCKLLVFLFILVILCILVRIFKIKKKYYYIKNIVIYLIYFNIMYLSFGYGDNYLYLFLIGSIFQILYMYIYKRYFK